MEGRSLRSDAGTNGRTADRGWLGSCCHPGRGRCLEAVAVESMGGCPGGTAEAARRRSCGARPPATPPLLGWRALPWRPPSSVRPGGPGNRSLATRSAGELAASRPKALAPPGRRLEVRTRRHDQRRACAAVSCSGAVDFATRGWKGSPFPTRSGASRLKSSPLAQKSRARCRRKPAGSGHCRAAIISWPGRTVGLN